MPSSGQGVLSFGGWGAPLRGGGSLRRGGSAPTRARRLSPSLRKYCLHSVKPPASLASLLRRSTRSAVCFTSFRQNLLRSALRHCAPSGQHAAQQGFSLPTSLRSLFCPCSRPCSPHSRLFCPHSRFGLARTSPSLASWGQKRLHGVCSGYAGAIAPYGFTLAKSPDALCAARYPMRCRPCFVRPRPSVTHPNRLRFAPLARLTIRCRLLLILFPGVVNELLIPSIRCLLLQWGRRVCPRKVLRGFSPLPHSLLFPVLVGLSDMFWPCRSQHALNC